MIHINLLSGERRATSRRAFQIAERASVIGSVILIVTAALVGWRYWTVTQAEAKLASDIDAARREETRLAEVLKQVADFENRRSQLQQRVRLIDELRRGQSAPVHMIDQISRALPDLTWLTSIKQDGYDVTIEGQCMSLSALSDFVGNLEATRYFKRPVEIIVSEATSSPGGPSVITFTVKGTFQMAGIEQPAAAAAPPPGAKSD